MEPIIGIGTRIEIGSLVATVTQIFGVKQFDKLGNSVIIPKVTLKSEHGVETIWGKELEESL